MKKKKLLLILECSCYFGEIPKILALFVLGFLLHIGWYSILIYFLLAPYRSFTGGFHLKTHWGCMISSIVLYIVPILIAKYITMPQEYFIYIIVGVIGVMSIVFILKYAPADTENIPILSKRERKIKRMKSYISLTILLAIILLVPDKIISYMLLYGIFLQNLTLTPIAYKITKNKYSYEVYTEETV